MPRLRFLASLGLPGMCGATGRRYLQNTGPMTGHVTGRARSPGSVRGDWSTFFTGHAAKGRSGFRPASVARGITGATGRDRVQIMCGNVRPGFRPASVTRGCTGRPGDTIYMPWGQLLARLLADLGRMEMYWATCTWHGGICRSGFWPAWVARGCTRANG